MNIVDINVEEMCSSLVEDRPEMCSKEALVQLTESEISNIIGDPAISNAPPPANRAKKTKLGRPPKSASKQSPIYAIPLSASNTSAPRTARYLPWWRNGLPPQPATEQPPVVTSVRAATPPMGLLPPNQYYAALQQPQAPWQYEY